MDYIIFIYQTGHLLVLSNVLESHGQKPAQALLIREKANGY